MKFTCEEFNEDKHMITLKMFYIERNIPLSESYPKIGFIVYSDHDGINYPVSIGFLRQIEGNYAQIDGLITNPSASKDERFKANDIITEKLLEKAKEIKCKGICSYSRDKNTITRALRHGFKILDHVVLVKDFKEL